MPIDHNINPIEPHETREPLTWETFVPDPMTAQILLTPEDFKRGPSTGRIRCDQPNPSAWDRLIAAEEAENDDE